MKQLSWTDAALYRAESRATPVHINSVAIYDPSTAPGGAVRFTGILRALEARLHLTPTFRRRLVDVPLGLGTPYWIEDKDFDLEYHVRHLALPKPGDWRQFCIQIARLHARQIDMSRPPWELTVIEGLDGVDGIPKGCFAISMKIHHAAIDGVSGAEMLSVIHDFAADAAAPEPAAQEWAGEQTPNPFGLLGRSALSGVIHPIRLLKVLGPRGPGIIKAAGTRILPGAGDEQLAIPKTRFSGVVSPHRVVDARFYDFSDVRRIKKAVEGATVNDVVLAYVGGAMRRYLSHHGELPDESLVAACPVSIRTPEQAGTGGNMLSGARQAIATDVADPLERLEVISTEGARQRAERAGVSAPALLEIAELVPGLLIGVGIRAMARFPGAGPSIANLAITNVPGPQQPMYFAGAKAVRLFGCGPIFSGMGVIHIVGTYNGELVSSFTADRVQLPDPAFYAECMDASFAELLLAAEA